MASLIAKQRTPTSNGWEDRHNTAVADIYNPLHSNREMGMARMLTGWAEYAKDHKARFDSAIGEDYVLGPAWQEIGVALGALLNGDLGRLDGGTLDGFILGTMQENGIDTEQM